MLLSNRSTSSQQKINDPFIHGDDDTNLIKYNVIDTGQIVDLHNMLSALKISKNRARILFMVLPPPSYHTLLDPIRNVALHVAMDAFRLSPTLSVCAEAGSSLFTFDALPHPRTSLQNTTR